MGACWFALNEKPPDGVQSMLDALNATTGWDVSLDELIDAGHRAIILQSLFGTQRGWIAEHDWQDVGPRFLEPIPDGKYKGFTIAKWLPDLVYEYYKISGRHEKTGRPYMDTLQKLGLEEFKSGASWIDSTASRYRAFRRSRESGNPGLSIVEIEMTHHKSASIAIFIFLLTATLFSASPVKAQTLKKVRMASSSTNVSFLALYTALNRGFFKDEGIDLEIIFMPANLASTAVLNGDVDYNGAVTGTIGAAVQGRPMKVLLFTVSKPLLFLIGQKNIKDLKQLKGKKIAGSSPGGSATLLANQALKQIGLEPGKDVSVLQMSGNAASRFAVLESGVVDASLLSVPENIIAHERGYNELLFLGDVVEFPQNGF